MTSDTIRRVRVSQAIAQALGDEMRSDPTVLVMGEDVADAGGPFKTSEGLLAEFGPARVRDTPIAEMGFVGAAVGAAVMGLRPVVEIMFVEFLGVALDQLVTEAAKVHFMSNGLLSAPLVLRASNGSGLGFGLQHSQTLENWVMATPGLKVVVPSDPQSAYGLTRAAVRDPGPVVVLECRALYATRGPLDTTRELPEIGRARVLAHGDDVTVVALGQTVRIAGAAIEAAGVAADLIDLATLVPWDRATVLESVRRTGRLVVVEESPRSGGWGSEIVAAVAGAAFGQLRAAPWRCCLPDLPIPFNRTLEAEMLPSPQGLAYALRDYVEDGAVPEPDALREGSRV